jgi:TatA/E family protein of Tat protein translocase
MFGIGMPEMLVLLAVALIVFGPKKLPELAKSLGRALGEFKRATSDLKQTIETETGMDEVRSTLDDVKEDIKSQVDLAGSVPDPTEPPSNSTPDEITDEPLGPDEPFGSDEPLVKEEPLDKVKSAFDELNSDPHESQTAPAADPDPEHQDTTKK